jgi:putative pre-16S rRNA nuclease
MPKVSLAAAHAKTVLAFDFGEKRIGIAVGDLETGLAHPLQTLHSKDSAGIDTTIGKLIREWRPERLIVGMPGHMDRSGKHPLAARCEAFGSQLAAQSGLSVEFVDERLTSWSADSALSEAGVRGRRRRDVLDAVAAQHILQAWLDRHD